MGTAATLREAAGLPFVQAPIPSRTGEFVHQINGTTYSVVVFPFVAAEPVGPGTYPEEGDRQTVLDMVGRIHAATGLVPPDLARREEFAVPYRDELAVALAQVDEPWTTGPYAEPARLLLREHREPIRVALAVFDQLVAVLTANSTGWVVSHGEPHARNVLRDGNGPLLLVDWDTAAIGPPERDLWMLLPEVGSADWSAYTDVTGTRSVSSGAIKAYRMWWDLSEIAIFVDWFRRPHGTTDDTAIAWGGLSGTFPLRPDYLVASGPDRLDDDPTEPEAIRL
jgi:spectinomycin phosphotransferase